MSDGRPVGRRSWMKGLAALGAAACVERGPGAAPARRASLFLGGDVHLGHGRTAPLLAGLEAELEGRLGVVNLEGPVGPAPVAPSDGTVRLANDPASLHLLASAGVRVAGVANNHAADLGEPGVARTREALEGASLLVASHGREAMLEVGGLRVALTAHDLAGGPPPAAELARARARADVLIATFHVTGPPSYVPRRELRAAVDAALGEGASVVAAHGTHALGPVERRGDAVIAWGLGNLVFSCDCTEEIDGALLLVELEPPRVAATIVPIEAGLRGGPARPSKSSPLLLDLFEALGSTRLERTGNIATF